jgi:hypothetical protein
MGRHHEQIEGGRRKTRAAKTNPFLIHCHEQNTICASSRRRCANMSTIFQCSAENAKIADWLAERRSAAKGKPGFSLPIRSCAEYRAGSGQLPENLESLVTPPFRISLAPPASQHNRWRPENFIEERTGSALVSSHEILRQSSRVPSARPTAQRTLQELAAL